MITDIRLSFLPFAKIMGTMNAYMFMENALGGYCRHENLIVINLPLIATEVFSYQGRGKMFSDNKTFEQAVCYVLTHEEIHAWLTNNEDHNTSVKFDIIAQKFMEGM